MNKDAHIMQPATVMAVRTREELHRSMSIGGGSSRVSTEKVAELSATDGTIEINLGRGNFCNIKAGDEIDIHMVPKGASVVIEAAPKTTKSAPLDPDNLEDGFYRLTSERASMKSVVHKIGDDWYCINEEGPVSLNILNHRGWTLDSKIGGMET